MARCSIIQRIWLVGVAVSALPPAAAWAAPVRYALEPEQAQVRFLGRSTLHDFEGETSDVRGDMMFDPERQALAAPARLAIPVDTIRTGIAARDRAMREMFESERFPEIVMTIDSATPLDAPPTIKASSRRYRLQGRLRIREIEQPVDFEAQATITEGAIDASGTLPLTIKQFDLHPPSVLGVIRVRQGISVDFTSHWTRRP
jgi:polyisoprenoid-binding protein YceI